MKFPILWSRSTKPVLDTLEKTGLEDAYIYGHSRGAGPI